MNTIILVDSLAGSPNSTILPHLTVPIAGRSILSRTCQQAVGSAYSCALFLACPADAIPPTCLPTTTHIVRSTPARSLAASANAMLDTIERSRDQFRRLPPLNGSSIVVAVPPDMPDMLARDIDLLVRGLVKEPACGVATLCRRATATEAIDRSVLKVVRRNDGISIRQFTAETSDERLYRHIDCWAFRIETLRKLADLPRTARAQQYGCDAVAWLEHGHQIPCIETDTNVQHITAERFDQYRAAAVQRNPWSRQHG